MPTIPITYHPPRLSKHGAVRRGTRGGIEDFSIEGGRPGTGEKAHDSSVESGDTVSETTCGG